MECFTSLQQHALITIQIVQSSWLVNVTYVLTDDHRRHLLTLLPWDNILFGSHLVLLCDASLSDPTLKMNYL